VEPTKRLDGPRNRPANLLLITHIGNGRQRPAALGLNVISHRCRRLVTHIHNGNRCPGPGERVAGTLTNARPAASDESDPICEFLSIHRLVTLPETGLPALDLRCVWALLRQA
jgi:hypothetical protein